MRRSLVATVATVWLLLCAWPVAATVDQPTPTPTPTQEPSPAPSVDVPFVDTTPGGDGDATDDEDDPATDPGADPDAPADGTDGATPQPTTDADGDDLQRPAERAPVRRAPVGDACSRGQYGDVLPDGTVDVGCDGVLDFAEQRSPVILRIEVRARPGEQVAVTVDERDVAGRVLRVDPVSTRGGSVERFPLLYRAPEGLDGRDGFSLWVSRGGYEREVRVVVDVQRSSATGVAAPPRGVLLGGSGDGDVVGVALAPGPGRALGPVVGMLSVVALGLVALLVAWVLLRRGGVHLPMLDEEPDGPSSTTFVAGT